MSKSARSTCTISKISKQNVVSYGFTLIELLVVVSILAILAGFSIPGFLGYIEDQGLRQAQDQVLLDLRKIQTRTLAGTGYESGNTTHWGVYFGDGADRYKYFVVNAADYSDLNSACSDTGEASTVLPGGARISTNGSYSETCIYFDFRTGSITVTPNTGINRIHVRYPGENNCASIYVNSAGRIYTTQGFESCN